MRDDRLNDLRMVLEVPSPLDWTCDLEAIGQPRGASTFCLQDAWARFWLKDAEDLASYRDEWSFDGCRPVVTGEIDWRSHGTGGPGGGAR